MQNEYSFFKLYGINRTVSATDVIFNNLKHPGATKSLEHLRRIVLIAGLSKGKCVTEESPYVSR